MVTYLDLDDTSEKALQRHADELVNEGAVCITVWLRPSGNVEIMANVDSEAAYEGLCLAMVQATVQSGVTAH